MTDDVTPSPDEAIKDAVVERYRAETEAARAQTTFWRTLAKWALAGVGVALAILIALAVYVTQVNQDTHEQGSQTRAKADQVLVIAREFECQQTPTPKGCPPQAPQQNAMVQAFIAQLAAQIVAQIEQVYPPPKAP